MAHNAWMYSYEGYILWGAVLLFIPYFPIIPYNSLLVIHNSFLDIQKWIKDITK